ncbi:MAG: serine hydrolase domain-containing protein [Deinococcota bacterium]
MSSVLMLALVASACTSAATIAAAQTPQDELQLLLQDYVDPADPGVVVVIDDNGERITAAYGSANLETREPVQLTDRFRIGSVSKPMVAAALLSLVDDGLLALNDPLTNYLPEAITSNIVNADATTVRQALQMTSGIADYLGTDAFLDAVEDAPNTFWTPEQVITFAYNEPAEFPVGTDYYYSNSNYILAHLVIESISGKPLADVLAEAVFAPAGMDTCYLETASNFAQTIVRGYDFGDDDSLVDVTEINDGVGLGDGGVICTASDLAKFLPALAGGQIISETMLTAMLTTVPNPDGAPYGLGIDVDEDGEFGLTLGHGGVTSGFQADMLYLPDEGVSVVAMTNFAESDVLTDIIFDATELVFSE